MGEYAVLIHSREQLARSRAIDAQLASESKTKQTEKAIKKVVFLGPSDCGKSTVMKQVRLTFGGEFSPDERDRYKRAIYDNIYDTVIALLDGMMLLDVLPDSPETQEHIEIIREAGRENGQDISLDLASSITIVWNDPDVQHTWARHNQFPIQDNGDFFLNNLARFLEPNYQPSTDDILATRIMTRNISQIRLTISGETFEFIDVGELSSIFFIVSLASFDQVLVENNAINRMVDAIELFDKIMQNPLLKDVATTVFLNKSDLFKAKIKKGAIEPHFPDFKATDSKNLYNSGISFFKRKFQDTKTKRAIFYHITQATDTAAMKNILSAVL